jgi:GT2 family glycosyltransferase
VTVGIDLFVIVHNSRQHIPGLIAGLQRLSLPVTAYFLDNASRDGSADLLAEYAAALPFRAFVLRSLRNHGFAAGMNLLARQSRGEFMFLLNPDTTLEPGCLEALVARALSDPRIAICEARQYPREHPKIRDSATGETTWCSCAAALIRRTAFVEVGGFDAQLYFMYCEDIDFSWRLWRRAWKCIYVSEAVVQHFTQDLLPGKRRTWENYYSFRNSLFLYYRFGRSGDRKILWKFLKTRFISGPYSARSRALFAIALIDHIRYIPYLLRGRDEGETCDHGWIRLDETSLSH